MKAYYGIGLFFRYCLYWNTCMRTIHISKGLDLPIEGQPEQVIGDPPFIKNVALLGADCLGARPKLLVKEGDFVQLGQKVLSDKKVPSIFYTAPAAGKVSKIHLGKRRSFVSMCIALGENPDQGVHFPRFEKSGLQQLDGAAVEDNLLQTGLWTAFRTRPYSKVPVPGIKPHSIFVNTMDTNPMALNSSVLFRRSEYSSAFEDGLAIISCLTDGTIHLCCAPDTNIPLSGSLKKVERTNFTGPHPAGLTGTHIHYLDPVSMKKTVWSISYQDVIAIGKTFISGSLSVDRVIALSGPEFVRPRLVRTRLGASVEEICREELKREREKVRLVAGSIFHGTTCKEENSYLGRFHFQISALQEGGPRKLLGWQVPAFNTFSVKRSFATSLLSAKRFEFSTLLHGSPRAMVPTGNYESVTALDILPTFLLRALLMRDADRAQRLGVLELDEEDLALYTFVCSGKNNYGPLLRESLDLIEKNG